jgi:hypothetical protein
MSNFCKHCGVKLEGNPTVCPSCNQSLNLASELLSKKSLDEVKKNLINASSKAISIAKDVGADLASETKKINEARKEATEASDFKGAEDKKAAVKNGVLIFWSKLTKKQRLMVLSVPILLSFWIFSGGSSKEKAGGIPNHEMVQNAARNGTLHLLPTHLQPDAVRNLPEGFSIGIDSHTYCRRNGVVITIDNSRPHSGC